MLALPGSGPLIQYRKLRRKILLFCIPHSLLPQRPQFCKLSPQTWPRLLAFPRQATLPRPMAFSRQVYRRQKSAPQTTVKAAKAALVCSATTNAAAKRYSRWCQPRRSTTALLLSAAAISSVTSSSRWHEEVSVLMKW